MTEQDYCPVWELGTESITHTLRDCAFASGVWRQVVLSRVISSFFTLSFQEWFLWNLNDSEKLEKDGLEWPTLFSILGWLLWKARNVEAFHQDHKDA